MRVPQFDRYARFMSGVGLLAAGGVIGSALFMGIYQQNFSELVQRNLDLEDRVNQLTQEIEPLKKYKNQQSIVSKINIVVENANADAAPLDKSIETEIRKRVYADLRVVLGQPLSAISANPKVYQKLIDGKIYAGIYEKNYTVNCKTMMLTPAQLTFWISTRVQN